MPTPVAYGAAVSFRDTAFSSTYSPGNLDVGTVGGVWVCGWAWVEASTAIARVNSLTIGGVAMTLGTDLDRNALLGTPSRMRKFSGFLPGKTGAQAVVATQTDTSGVSSNAGKIRLDLQVYNYVTSVVSEVDTPVTVASSNVISATIGSATGRTDVWVAHTPINQSGGTAMAVTVAAPVVLRSAAVPQANETIIVDRPGAASSTLAATITNSFTPYSVGTLYSLSGDAGATTHAASGALAGVGAGSSGAAARTAAGGPPASGGALTSRPLVRNTAAAATDPWALWAPGELFTVFVHHLTTGALVVKRTAVATNAAGVLSFTDAALSAATTYRVDFRHEATGAWGLDTLTAT